VHTPNLGRARSGAIVPLVRVYINYKSMIAIVELPGDRFVVASWDPICVCDVETGACLTTLTGHNAPVLAMTLANEHTLGSGGCNESLRVYDVSTVIGKATAFRAVPSPIGGIARGALLLAAGRAGPVASCGVARHRPPIASESIGCALFSSFLCPRGPGTAAPALRLRRASTTTVQVKSPCPIHRVHIHVRASRPASDQCRIHLK